jgi:mannose-6-phosphate isomerase-like protein (cupin superfamily)
MTIPTRPSSRPDNRALDRQAVIHLATDQSMALLATGADIWRRPDEVAEFGHGRVLSVFDYTAPWDYWERHPVGVEFVRVISGSVVFHVDEGSGPRPVGLATGQSLLVPEGAWHRAEMDEPASMLFVTPTPALTEHRPA